jgi:radical SAM/Cys-rich protein
MILKTLHRQSHPLASPIQQLEILHDPNVLGAGRFAEVVKDHVQLPLLRRELTTLQINVGRVCNQTCGHCHVDAGPDRREAMNAETAQQIIDFLKRSRVQTLDITGGAPEMNPHFRMLVEAARTLNKEVIDRCNLTILLANGFTDLPQFLADHQVQIIASLPCYLESNCDAQRGDGVFQKSIQAIKILNELGYAQDNSLLQLNLVYNPVGTGLPPDQAKLESDYREQLLTRYGIRFNRLFTITNMPVSRYLEDLIRRQKYAEYMHKLLTHFNANTLDGLMCRSLVSVDWNGYLYDCDFNQMLDLPIPGSAQRLHISNVQEQDLIGLPIATDNHCFGCTAGCGSSCTGSLT